MVDDGVLVGLDLLAIVVAVDDGDEQADVRGGAAVDGLLIGLATGASLDANAGLILSLALAIEMGFLYLPGISNLGLFMHS